MQIDICLFDGVDELDVVGPFEVLARAARMGAPWTEVRLVTLGGRPPEAIGQHGLRLFADGVLADRPDILLVPGGGWADGTVGVRTEVERGDLVEAVRLRAPHAAVVAAVCTGAMVLAAAGLLTGRAATTHQSAVADLAAAGAQVADARVVDTGRILTAGGVTSGIDLALWLVEREAGAPMAEAIARRLEYARTGRVHIA